ncbi:endo alpha-1,4 polygalactosaminidase [Marinobacter fonticola]|uniref:endo alpha-1,4 polygalactosaminidase n=1 Tax=Marinobacter fonticola TaxID=2603215 RepID=UPI0011E63783|nr:endo alpha-1,4 polygalactosaminidase [Marinobacter fonticola]
MGYRLLPWILLTSLIFSANHSVAALGNIGFYYGSEAPVNALMAYDWLVLQPPQVSQSRLTTLSEAGVETLAYVSLGEIARSHRLFGAFPETGLMTDNPAWNSRVLDLRREDVRQILQNQLIEPAFEAGFQGVFLDTLDSYQLTEAGQTHPNAFLEAQAELIRTIRDKHPSARIVINRGFDLPEDTHSQVDALAFESYREGFDPARKRYRAVPETDREWLDRQLNHWRQAHPEKPLIAIDYIQDPDAAGTLAQQLRADGFIPYVSNPQLTRLGPTQPGRVKREVLVIQDSPSTLLSQSSAHRYAAVPLEELGYIPVYRHVGEPLPDEPLADRYAGILIWWEVGARSQKLCRWLKQHQATGLPVVTLGLLPADPACQSLTRAPEWAVPTPPLTYSERQSSVGQYESQRLPVVSGVALPEPEAGRFWLTVTDREGQRFHPIYTHDGGGVAVAPYLFEPGPEDQLYWLFDPIAFLDEAFGHPDFPASDVTTESGRLILTSHIDGDGFVSRAEVPGNPLAAQVIMDDILQAYNLPHTVSVIEAETSPDGIYPKTSAEAEQLARQIFRLDNVEVASHSFSHPFFWQIVAEDGKRELPVFAEYGYSLNVPEYTPELEREVAGSIRYINRKLTPPGKSVQVFLWTGDALPTEAALRKVREAGLANVNGGDTHPLPYDSELAGVWPIARPVGDELQIYAPVMNENVYTNLWQGPYYGFRDVVDTFRLLEARGRLKPLSLYYHFYSGSKPAALGALHTVYDYAMSQPTTQLYLSQYADRARTAYRSALMRDDGGQYHWRGVGQPHTVRIDPHHQFPDLTNSQGVAGYRDAAGKRFVHLAGNNPKLMLSDRPPSGPYLREANAVITHWSRSEKNKRWHITLGFAGHQPVNFILDNTSNCRVLDGPKTQFNKMKNAVAVRLTLKHVDSLALECR